MQTSRGLHGADQSVEPREQAAHAARDGGRGAPAVGRAPQLGFESLVRIKVTPSRSRTVGLRQGTDEVVMVESEFERAGRVQDRKAPSQILVERARRTAGANQLQNQEALIERDHLRDAERAGASQPSQAASLGLVHSRGRASIRFHEQFAAIRERGCVCLVDVAPGEGLGGRDRAPQDRADFVA